MRATKRWEDKAYWKTLVRFPADAEPQIRAAAERAGKSLNAFISGAVMEVVEKF
jgi:predicted HicB family RNase H-like nuclease